MPAEVRVVDDRFVCLLPQEPGVEIDTSTAYLGYTFGTLFWYRWWATSESSGDMDHSITFLLGSSFSPFVSKSSPLIYGFFGLMDGNIYSPLSTKL